MEWVEASGSTVAVAVEAALAELGIKDPERASVEVLQEPKPGFLGMGKQPAVVKVSVKPAETSGGRRRSRGTRGRSDRGDSRQGRGGGSRSDSRGNGGRSGSGSGGNKDRKRDSDGRSTRGDSRESKGKAAGGDGGQGERKEQKMDAPQIDEALIAEQAAVAQRFIEGLLTAFGLEGTVSSRIEEDTVYIDVDGEQTEALVGPKGSVMQAVTEITRTVVQRTTEAAPRMRLDIAGYAERRREALRIYTTKLAERVTAEGGEVMLEPMNAADRKVVHDTVADIDGVRSFSEGEDPDRAVVIAPAD